VTITTSAATETDLPVLNFAVDLPGFPGRRHFCLVTIADLDTLFMLTSVEDEELKFLVVPAAPFFPDYTPELDDEYVTLLGLTEPEDALVFLMVNVGEKAEDSTVNLMAPVVVNQRTLAAAQVVLVGSDYPLQAPLKRT